MPFVPEEYRKLGEFIRDRRRNHLKVTQKYIATRTDVSDSYICQIESGTTKVCDRFLRRLEGALEVRSGTLFLEIGKPPMDLVRTLLEPRSRGGDPLEDINPDEREELISYLKFLRVQAQIRGLSS